MLAQGHCHSSLIILAPGHEVMPNQTSSHKFNQFSTLSISIQGEVP